MPVDPQALQIVLYPDPILRQQAKPVERVDEEVRAVVERMICLMEEADGAGLAAPQVGLPWRIFLSRAAGGTRDIEVFINPELQIDDSESVVGEEGCLSLPNIYVDIRRSRGITITAQGLDGQTFKRSDADFVARVWQHENDHLDGTLIIDRMSTMDRLAKRRAIKDLEAAARGT
jgi:peptide deformylase